MVQYVCLIIHPLLVLAGAIQSQRGWSSDSVSLSITSWVWNMGHFHAVNLATNCCWVVRGRYICMHVLNSGLMTANSYTG